jgi:hypothetical protein
MEVYKERSNDKTVLNIERLFCFNIFNKMKVQVKYKF